MVNSGSKTLPAAQRESAEVSSEPAPRWEGGCLDDGVALRFVSGEVDQAMRSGLQDHLVDCAQCRLRVNRIARQHDSSAGPPLDIESWNSSRLAHGLLLAQRYRVERFVARGGMGEVYDVYDTVLGERVALKTVTPSLGSTAEAIAQLKAEVQLARRVSHKNVCRIYDLGTHATDEDSAVVFLTMEFVEGTSLAEHLRAHGAIDVPDAARLAAKILEGLQAAHEAGVLHRDLKSDNIMLRRSTSGQLHPVLMDFGLASALNPNSSRVSSDHALVGSLSYMAPEQVQGEPLRVATDLYAFGVVFFEMLTGRLPFLASTPALAAIKRLQEPAPRLRSIDASLPALLDNLVARCLEKDPKARFNSAHAAWAELSRLPGISHDSGQNSEPPSVPESGGRSTLGAAEAPRRTRDLLILAAALLVLVLGWWGLTARAHKPSAASPTDALGPRASAAVTPTGAVPPAALQSSAASVQQAAPSSAVAASSTAPVTALDSAGAASAANPTPPSGPASSSPATPPATTAHPRPSERTRADATAPNPSAPSPALGSASPVAAAPIAGSAASEASTSSCPPGLLCPKQLGERTPAAP